LNAGGKKDEDHLLTVGINLMLEIVVPGLYAGADDIMEPLSNQQGLSGATTGSLSLKYCYNGSLEYGAQVYRKPRRQFLALKGACCLRCVVRGGHFLNCGQPAIILRMG